MHADTLPPPEIYATPLSTTFGAVSQRPGMVSYPPSYRTETSDPGFIVGGGGDPYAHEHLAEPGYGTYSPPAPPFSAPPPDDTLIKRLSLRLLPAPDPHYISPEQAAEDDRTLDAEEKEMLKRGMFNWPEMRRWRFWIRKEWWAWYIVLVICGVLVTLMTLYNEQIIAWMRPFANKLKDLPGGWAIPIGILFVISFPPLFGHEVVMILCGVVWGLWIGFAIVSVGTFIGEMGNFYAFKYCFRARAAKLERKNMNYALLAHVVREGGLKIAVMARLSVIPGHFLTGVLSTCGLHVVLFAIGTILSLPKNLAIVYLGVALAKTDEDSNSKTVEYSVIAASFLFSILAAWYIYWCMNKSRLVVWRMHRANLAKKGVAMEEIPQDPTEYATDGKPVAYGKLSGEEDDAARPILAEQMPLGRTTSTFSRPGTVYASGGYEYPSDSTADLPLQHLPSRTASPPSEHDLASIPLKPGHSDFPEPIPHLTRAASNASSLYPQFTTRETGYLDPPGTAFPMPQPYVPQPHEQRRGVQLVDPGYVR